MPCRVRAPLGPPRVSGHYHRGSPTRLQSNERPPARVHRRDGKRLLRDAAPLHGHRGSVRAVAPVADDGRAVISCSWDGTMRLWDVREGAWLRNGDTSAVLQAKENDGWVETVAVVRLGEREQHSRVPLAGRPACFALLT